MTAGLTSELQEPTRAVVHDMYGPPDVLRLESIARPVPRHDDVLVIIEAREYRAVIDRFYPLADVVEAATYVETGQKTGNVVLTVNRSGDATTRKETP